MSNQRHSVSAKRLAPGMPAAVCPERTRAASGGGPTDRSRALLHGTLAIAGVGALDVLLVPGGTARLPYWAAWLGCFLLALPFHWRGPGWLVLIWRLITGGWSIAMLAGMAHLGGGTRSPFFYVMMLVPLLAWSMVPEDPLDPAAEGLASLVGGGALMRLEGRDWLEVLIWASLCGFSTAFALVASVRYRYRQQEHLRSRQERAEALQRLAEAEQARAQAERWAAVGRIADQVAHDVNSPLASVRSNLLFLREELGAVPGSDADSAIEDAVACVDRIRRAIAGLQAQARPPPVAAGEVEPL